MSDKLVADKLEDYQKKHRTHACPSCGYVERCAKKYTHVCGRCGHRWRTGLSAREQKQLKRESLIQQQAKLDPWSSR